MASKSKIAPKVKPSRVFGFATDYPDMNPAGYAPGANFAAQEFTEFNKDLPDYAKLWPGSYRVEVFDSQRFNLCDVPYKQVKGEEAYLTCFIHTSGPFAGQIVPRDITYKKDGEVVRFETLHAPEHIKPVQTIINSGYKGDGTLSKSAVVGKYNFASVEI